MHEQNRTGYAFEHITCQRLTLPWTLAFIARALVKSLHVTKHYASVIAEVFVAEDPLPAKTPLASRKLETDVFTSKVMRTSSIKSKSHFYRRISVVRHRDTVKPTGPAIRRMNSLAANSIESRPSGKHHCSPIPSTASKTQRSLLNCEYQGSTQNQMVRITHSVCGGTLHSVRLAHISGKLSTNQKTWRVFWNERCKQEGKAKSTVD